MNSQDSASILQTARIQWQSDGTPVAETFDDVYFSRAGGLAESEYVFLRHNGLPQRFGDEDFVIAETGFGTGLNALLTAQAWRKHSRGGTLHFISFEKYPLTPADLARAHACWPELAPWAATLQRRYPARVPGWHHVALAEDVRLWLWFGDVHEGLADLDVAVDAWYLDGFAPARNPEMWTDALFERMAGLSVPGTTFATFTAAGMVRRGLAAAGFEVEKVPGFGRKREMLRGRWRGGPVAERPERPQSLAVVGAGLAGAHVARQAAEAGVAVTVFDAEPPARGASGNAAGVFHPLVTADWSLRSQWYQLALEVLSDRLDPALADGVPGGWCPMPHFLIRDTWRERMGRFEARFGSETGLFESCEPPCEGWEGSVVAYERAGWVSPPEWVRWLLAHEGIEQVRQHVAAPEWIDGRWQLGGRAFDVVVWATGWRPQPLPGWPADLIRPVAGQVECFDWRDEGVRPDRPWIHEGYSVPLSDGLVVGATFDKGADAPISEAARQANLARVRAVCSQVAVGDAGVSRVSVRPTTRDHMPIVGLWPGVDGMGVSLGHGARGLLSAPLAAMWLCHDLGIISLPQFKKLRHASRIERFFE